MNGKKIFLFAGVAAIALAFLFRNKTQTQAEATGSDKTTTNKLADSIGQLGSTINAGLTVTTDALKQLLDESTSGYELKLKSNTGILREQTLPVDSGSWIEVPQGFSGYIVKTPYNQLP